MISKYRMISDDTPSGRRELNDHNNFLWCVDGVVGCYLMGEPRKALDMVIPIWIEKGVSTPAVREAYESLKNALQENLKDQPKVTDLAAVCTSLECYGTLVSGVVRRAIVNSIRNYIYHNPPARLKNLHPDSFKLEGLVLSPGQVPRYSHLSRYSEMVGSDDDA